MKKIVAFILCAAMLCAFSAPAFAAANLTFTFTPDATALERGDEVKIAITVTSSGVVDSLGFRLQYDKDVFEIVEGVNAIKLLYGQNNGECIADFNAEEGNFATSFEKDFAPNGEAGYITLRVKATAPYGKTTVAGDPAAKLDSAPQNITASSLNFTVSGHIYTGNTDATCEICGEARILDEEHKSASVASGTLEGGLRWRISASNTLTITGVGEMPDFTAASPAPWADKLTSIKKIVLEDGVTAIGNNAFKDCAALTGMEIPASVASVGENAFAGCDALTTVLYNGTEAGKNAITVAAGNDKLTAAQWHYVAAIIPGIQRAYKCADCDKLFCLDGKESLFTDVLTTSWQYTPVAYAVEKGLFTGKGNDEYGRVKFDPDAPITREQFVKVLHSAEGKPEVQSDKVFPDVVPGTWYVSGVLWAYEAGVTSGLGTGKFGVGNSITRQDLVAMLYKYAKLKGYTLETESGKIDQYADGDKVASYAKNAMDWAVTNGVISGSGTGSDLSTWKLNPTGKATRAQCAAMLRSFMNKYNP